MEPIDQALFNFSPRAGLAAAIMAGFLVFAVALDLTWDQFRRVLKSPKAPGVGLAAQYLILPAAAFGIGLLMAATPSIALGLLLVTCCPALPGVGASIANLISYSEARRASSKPELFGSGAPEGVIAAESANSSSEGGSLDDDAAFTATHRSTGFGTTLVAV